MAETDIETAKLPPDTLVGEIERTRADLARTIDAIADRVAPGNVARRTADRARERLSQVDPLIGGAVALAAVSITCYVIWRKLRRLSPGGTNPPYPRCAPDRKERDRIGRAAPQPTDLVSSSYSVGESRSAGSWEPAASRTRNIQPRS